MTRLLFAPLSISFVAWTCRADPVHPPNDIVLFPPPDQVPLNSTLQVGASVHPNLNFTGFQIDLDLSYNTPNGTNHELIKNATLAECPWSADGVTVTLFNTTEAGRYTMFWNISYGYTMDCVQFQFQHWTLNKSFEVTSTPTTDDSPVNGPTITSIFPNIPTGLANITTLNSDGSKIALTELEFLLAIFATILASLNFM